MAPVAGERIRAVRDLLGVSQAELSEATQVSQSLISQVENGSRQATEELITRIAAATATPRSFFEVPPPEVPLGTLRFRRLVTARRRDTKKAKALFDEAYRVVAELLSDARYVLPELPLGTGRIEADDIENLAQDTREALQLGGDGPVRHVTRACERAGIPVVPITLLSESDADSGAPGHFGISYWPGPNEAALIGDFSNGTGDRQRFTLAHELGHLVLHTRRRVVEDAEGEANRFAGAFLVPRERAIEIFDEPVTLRDFIELKAYWGVSIQAFIMRGAHLGRIDERRKASLFKQLSSRGWRKTEPVTVHSEQPILVWRLLASKYGEPVPYRRVADDVGLHAIVLRSLSPQPA
jgi:Zn-dependent peptidase ImmA (M78 family)/DNA-binding XRE family transcriptional regulator